MKINPKTWSKKQRITGIVVASALVFGGSTGLSLHNQQVQAQQVQKAKDEKKAYKDLTTQVEQEVSKAYESREPKAIESAQTAIKKLKAKDQSTYQSQLNQLISMLEQVKTTENLLTTLEKTKADGDVTKAQKAIDEEKNTYLAQDKKTHQARLNKVKHIISLEKTAKQAVEAYQKSAMDDEKLKVAQKAVEALTDSSSKALKDELNAKIKDSQEQAKKAREAENNAQASSSNNSQANAQNTSDNANTSAGNTSTASNFSNSGQNNSQGTSNNSSDWSSNGSNNSSHSNSGSTNNSNSGGSSSNSNNNSGGNSSGGNSSSSGNNNNNGGGNSGGGSTSPSEPSGPPAGWIVPPYPIGSAELVNWLADMGYSGYWSSGEYIQPYK